MVETIDVIPFGYKLKVGSNAILDMGELYKTMIYWFTYNYYAWKETYFLHEETPTGVNHIEIKWEAIKEVSPYIKFIISMDFLIFLKKIEVDIEGKKAKREIGTVEIRTGAKIIKGESWDKSKGTKFLRNVYERYLIKERIEDYKKDIYLEAHKLYNEIRAFLEMHQYKENI